MARSRGQEIARLTPPTQSPRTVDLRRHKGRSFSAFQYIEEQFPVATGRDGISFRRLFSQARNRDARTLIVEQIEAVGAVADENAEIAAMFPTHEPRDLLRYTFWNEVVRKQDLDHLNSERFIGYAILKPDCVKETRHDKWHVFESVFQKPRHTFIPCAKTFNVRAANSRLEIRGMLYCEQNGLNKACAQVAIRTLAASGANEEPFFSAINKCSADYHMKHPDMFEENEFSPRAGLHPPQIAEALRKFGYACDDIDYEQEDDADKKALPFHRYLYAGLESGAGALVGFKYGRTRKGGLKHIMPVFGHTFGQDAWVPRSEAAYFHVGEAKYIPSDAWLGSFVCHDDRFGSNYCFPRFYIDKKTVSYVSALIPPSAKHSSLIAEAYGIQSLNTLAKLLKRRSHKNTNPWTRRLLAFRSDNQVVLRALPITPADYIEHLKSSEYWEFKRENPNICD